LEKTPAIIGLPATMGLPAMVGAGDAGNYQPCPRLAPQEDISAVVEGSGPTVRSKKILTSRSI
jgi:hypothetical protein